MSFNIENEDVFIKGKRMTPEIFIGRNLKIEYDTNTTGRRL